MSIAQSDYTLSGSYTFTTASIDFSIDEKYANCSFEDSCDFESGPCHWEFIDTDSSTIITDPSGNSFLNGAVAEGSLNHVTTLWRTTVNDSYCGLSFVYKAESALLQVSMEGLGEVWSSGVVMMTTSLLQWESITVYMDVKGVEHVDKRLLAFEMVVAVDGASGSVAVDNVTLHPCVNCEAKGNMSSVCEALFSSTKCHGQHMMYIDVST